MGTPSQRGKRAARWLVLIACSALPACQFLSPPEPSVSAARLQEALAVIESPRANPRKIAAAQTEYRRTVDRILPSVLAGTAVPTFELAPPDPPDWRAADGFTSIEPVTRTRVSNPGLHRDGLGAPAVGRIFPGGPNAPRRGYQTPLTAIALPQPSTTRFRLGLADPLHLDSVAVGGKEVPVAMDLDAPLDAARAMGPDIFAGLRYLLRANRFRGQAKITFLQPYDPDKRPLVLAHGLMNSPRVWDRLVRDLLADPIVRDHYQIWFFFYPTAQPVPLSALQLREALDDAVRRHDVRQPMVLIGFSMGGVLSRAQVSALTLADAEQVLPGVSSLPEYSPARRALVFEPRQDVSRVIFLFTPHRGSRLATWSPALTVARLIRLPDWVRTELTDALNVAFGQPVESLPTSINGLSPNSSFLLALDRTTPTVPTHSIIGNRGRRGSLLTSSDGVVPYTSAHLAWAESELVVPTGHSGVDHALTVQELERILKENLESYRDARADVRAPAASGCDQAEASQKPSSDRW
jgi:pimeloyl-ACP methyl ester carboxylesterase